MLKLRNGSKGDSNTGSIDCDSGILPLTTELPPSTFLGKTKHNREEQDLRQFNLYTKHDPCIFYLIFIIVIMVL